MKITRFQHIFFWIPEIYLDKDYTSGKLERPLMINWLKWNFEFRR